MIARFIHIFFYFCILLYSGFFLYFRFQTFACTWLWFFIIYFILTIFIHNFGEVFILIFVCVIFIISCVLKHNTYKICLYYHLTIITNLIIYFLVTSIFDNICLTQIVIQYIFCNIYIHYILFRTFILYSNEQNVWMYYST